MHFPAHSFAAVDVLYQIEVVILSADDLSLRNTIHKQTCTTPSTSWIDPEFGNDGDLSQTISP